MYSAVSTDRIELLKEVAFEVMDEMAGSVTASPMRESRFNIVVALNQELLAIGNDILFQIDRPGINIAKEIPTITTEPVTLARNYRDIVAFLHQTIGYSWNVGVVSGQSEKDARSVGNLVGVRVPDIFFTYRALRKQYDAKHNPTKPQPFPTPGEIAPAWAERMEKRILDAIDTLRG